MEFLNWKKILLEWVNRLEFLGRPCYSLVEIESFYNGFKENFTATNIVTKNLDSFFKYYYPEFQPLLKEGKICPEDYVFGYSLMLFFCCVTKPEEKIRKVCKSMQEETQLVIKTFLQNLLERNSFSKATIKAVIETSVPAKMSDVLPRSPKKTLLVDVPITPKTKILNEWNTENRKLKALVETERYEKGFLEQEMKKKDDQVNAMNQERRKFLTYIQELKCQLADKDMENIPPNDNPQMESLKHRLRKEVAEKDDDIKFLQNQVIQLSTKYGNMEVQYNKAILSTVELTAKVDEITENCEKKLQHIKGLEITIKEYQKYLNESTSKGKSLDTSSDNLDDSYTAAMANLSNRSMSSPENLGKVVDIQLREKILLCDELMQKCNQVEQEKFDLNEQLGDRLQQINICEAKYRDLEAENLQNVKRYEDKLVEIAALSTESAKNLHELQALQLEFDSLMSKVNESAQRIEDLTGAKSTLEQQLDALRDSRRLISEENSSLLLQMETLTADRNLRTVQHELRMIVARELVDWCIDYQNERAGLFSSNEMLTSERDALTAKLTAANSIEEKLLAEKLALTEKISDKEIQTQKLIDQCNDYRNHHDSLEEALADLTKQFESLESTAADLASSNEKLTSERDTLAFDLTAAESTGNELSIEKLSLTEIIADKENEIQKLVDRCRDYQNDRDSLRETVADLTDQSQSLRSKAEGLVSSNEMLTSERDALTAKLLAAKSIEETLSTEKLSLTEKISDKENEVQKLIDQIESLESTAVNLTASNEFLTSERDALISNLTVAESIRKELSTEKSSLTETIADKDNQIQKLMDQCTVYRNDHDALEKSKLDFDVCQGQINELTEAVAELNANKQQLIEINENLNREIVADRETLTQLRIDLQAMHDKFSNEEKAIECSIGAESTKLSDENEELVRILESTENSRDDNNNEALLEISIISAHPEYSSSFLEATLNDNINESDLTDAPEEDVLPSSKYKKISANEWRLGDEGHLFFSERGTAWVLAGRYQYYISNTQEEMLKKPAYLRLRCARFKDDKCHGAAGLKLVGGTSRTVVVRDHECSGI